MEVRGSESWPGVEGRWVEVSAHLDPLCVCAAPSRALVVTSPGFDLWVCSAVAPVSDDWSGVLASISEPEGEFAVARCAAVLGVPWADVTEPVLVAQVMLLASWEESLAALVRESSPDQLLALRQHVFGGRPADVVRALRCVRDYAAVVQ